MTTFTVNYTGPPFMESLRSNTAMFAVLLGACAAGLLVATGAVPLVAAWLDLVPLPAALGQSLVSTAFVTAVGCYTFERAAQRLI